MAKDLTAIRIDGVLVDGLKQIIASADKDSVYRDRSVNWLIGRAVEEFIERHKQEPKGKSKKATHGEDPKQGF